MGTEIGADWTPAQYAQPEAVDLRHLQVGPKGYKETKKRRHDEMLAWEVVDEPTAAPMDADGMAAQENDGKRQKVDSQKYKTVLGKRWKAPAERAATVMKAKPNASWEKQMAEKAAQKAFKEHKQAAQEAIKSKHKAAAEHRRLAKERKQENQKKSAVVTKITNAATLKKMMKSKKLRKKLKTADTN